MNPLIKKQLDKVKNVVLSYDDSTTSLHISRNENGKGSGLYENDKYLIELADYIIHPFEGFTLHDNWNKGNVPKYLFMKCVVNKVMGKMILISGIGYDFTHKCDTDYEWSGWLPVKAIKVIERLE